MIVTLRQALELLTAHERGRLVLLLGIVILVALAEVAAVLSVVPFLAVLADPGIVSRNAALSWLQSTVSPGSTERFLFLLGCGAFFLLIGAAVVRILGTYAMIRFAQMRRHTISSRLLESYLGRPYEFFLGRHSGDMTKSILSEVDQVVTTVLQPAVLMLGNVVSLLAMVVLLLTVDPMVAIGAGVVLIGAYALIYLIVRGPVDRAGHARAAANSARFEAASEALGGIKEVRLVGREQSFLDRFRTPSFKLARNFAIGTTLANVPRYAIEAVAFGGVLLLALVLMLRADADGAGAMAEVLPLLGLFAFAGYRMLPAIQAIYNAITQITFGAAAVAQLHHDLIERAGESRALHAAPPEPLALKSAIRLSDLGYRYPGNGGAGLSGISVEIPVRTSLGIVGGTGAGKTTLIDVLLGLLEPQSGAIEIDGEPLNESSRPRWRASVGYVPQEIFLLDTTVAENIALGVPRDQIDMGAVRRAAAMAQINGFVEGELEAGYEARVGERGVRLSGGQRQRIGIARALYQDPAVLVFDEATSALDTATEAQLMTAIGTLSGVKTMIMIAHRLSTIRACDQIVVLRDGKVAGIGTYEDLKRENPEFQKIAGAVSAA